MESSADRKISIAVMAYYVVLIMQYFILLWFKLLNTHNGAIVQSISKVLVALIFLYALPVVLKRSKLKFVLIYFLAVSIFTFNYFVFPDNFLALKGIIFPFFFMCLPAFIYSLSLNDWDEFKQIMRKASYVVFILGAVLGGLIFSEVVFLPKYSMSFSYYMLLPTIMFLDSLLDKFSLRLLLLTLISLLFILAIGSRGAILCTITFVFLKVIRLSANLNYRKTLAFLTVFSIGVVGCIFAKRIFITIYDLLLSIGIESRSIRLFLRGNLDLSGRDVLYQNLLEEILDNPILGLGLGGDRIVLGERYAHNVFLEVLANFGVLFGIIIIVLICILIVRLLLTKNDIKYNIFIIWLCLGFVHFMVSSSYLIDIRFWIFLGIAIKQVTQGHYTGGRLGDTFFTGNKDPA